MRKELESLGLQIATVTSRSDKYDAAIAMIQTEIENMKIQPKEVKPGVNSELDLTLVIGHIPVATCLDDAKKWVHDQCVQLKLSLVPDKIFSNGDYKSVIFVKTPSIEFRDKLLQHVQSVAKASAETDWTKRVFAKQDQPIQIRIAEAALFAMKRMLSQWGYNKACIRVDTELR